jgi:hypothetical protein
MEKPKRVFAIVLWVLGLAMMGLGALRVGAFLWMIVQLEFSSGPAMVNTYLLSGSPTAPTAMLLDGGLLAGLGVLIELVDQILWRGLSENQRAARLKSSRRFLGL